MSLTPEERQRIYEEEKARVEAREQAERELQQRKQSQNTSSCCGCFVLAVVLCVLFSLINSGSSHVTADGPPLAQPPVSAPRPQGVNPTFSAPSMDSPEMQLASLETNHTVEAGDPQVKEFSALLNSIHRKTNGDRQGIANVIVSVQEEMNKQGVYEGVLELAQHLNDSMPAKGGPFNFADVAAAYEVLRTHGGD